MIGIFLIIFFVVLCLLGLATLVMVALVVFGFHSKGYKKTAKFLAIFFFSILFVGTVLMMFFLFQEDQSSKKEIKESLQHTQIFLKDDFEVVQQKNEWDFTYHRMKFTLKISDDDFAKLTKQHPNMMIRDSVKHPNNTDFDTLKVKIDKNKMLYYYRAHHNFDN